MRFISITLLALFMLLLPHFASASTFSAANDTVVLQDTVYMKDLLNTANMDSVLEAILLQKLEEQGKMLARQNDSIEALHKADMDSSYVACTTGDSTLIKRRRLLSEQYNPLCIELVFKPIERKINWDGKLDFGKLYFGTPKPLMSKEKSVSDTLFSNQIALRELRDAARVYLSGHNAGLYKGMYNELPDISQLKNRKIHDQEWKKVKFGTDGPKGNYSDIQVEKIKVARWVRKGSAIFQFSQNYISKNWYKGGNSNISILGILDGSINYDNKDNIQWENTAEWRAGFNSVEGDTLRKLSTNDDVFRIQSKLGIKAFDKFYYTGSVEFLTQFFNTYKEANSPELKTAAFAPIRLNIGVGLDYKPNDQLSVMLAPIAYKFVYVRDTAHINQNDFGVESDKDMLNEVGSSLKVVYSFKPIDAIQLDSRFYLYTNYKKVEVELELVANFIINRYLSARVSLYPRYDSTAILAEGEKAKLQFKEFVSIGFAHKFTETLDRKKKVRHL